MAGHPGTHYKHDLQTLKQREPQKERSRSEVDRKDKKHKKHRKKSRKNMKSHKKSRRHRDRSSSSSNSSSCSDSSSESKSSEDSSNDSSDSNRHRKKKNKSKKNSKSGKKQRKAKSKKKSKKQSKRASSTESEELTWDRILKIVEQEGIEQALRVDAFSLLLNSIQTSRFQVELQNMELMAIFKQFQRTQDSNLLLTRLLAHSEDMIQYFIIDNFNNSDQVVFNQLRSQRNVDYFNSFLQFQQHKKKEILLQSLSSLIKRQENVRLSVHKAPNNQARQESENIRDAFGNAIKEIMNSHAVSVLKHSFSQGSNSSVHQLLQAYMFHKD